MKDFLAGVISSSILFIIVVLSYLSYLSITSIPSKTPSLVFYEDAKFIVDTQAQYAHLNSKYFDNTLPNKIEINVDDKYPHEMADTSKELRTDGVIFVISFNRKYLPPIFTRYTSLTLEHEMCHIKTWGSKEDNNGHGEEWRMCMYDLERKLAFREFLID